VLKLRWVFIVGLVLCSAFAVQAQTCECPPLAPEVELLVPEVINVYPHDDESYTQGLLIHEGTFYESAGEYGFSDVRQVDIETGEVLRSVELNQQFFAEGLALVDDRLIQLTWQENTAIVWDLESFQPSGTYLYETHGWGLCYDGEQLYMSDGSSNLFVRDPRAFSLQDMIAVTREGEPVRQLNELECVGDVIYANRYQTDEIVRIDKATGAVTGVIDASGLLTEAERAELEAGDEVLNGIAYDAESDTFFITGKHWDKMFEVRFVTAN
jgi:glutaminyl-peptide cyclotransferase